MQSHEGQFYLLASVHSRQVFPAGNSQLPALVFQEFGHPSCQADAATPPPHPLECRVWLLGSMAGHLGNVVALTILLIALATSPMVVSKVRL